MLLAKLEPYAWSSNRPLKRQGPTYVNAVNSISPATTT